MKTESSGRWAKWEGFLVFALLLGFILYSSWDANRKLPHDRGQDLYCAVQLFIGKNALLKGKVEFPVLEREASPSWYKTHSNYWHLAGNLLCNGVLQPWSATALDVKPKPLLIQLTVADTVIFTNETPVWAQR